MLKKKIDSTLVRILSALERAIGEQLNNVDDKGRYVIDGSDLKLIRHEILNAVNDLKRSVDQIPLPKNAQRLEVDVMQLLNNAEFDMRLSGPQFMCRANNDSIALSKLRRVIGAGAVGQCTDGTYFYVCATVKDVINFIIPLLDQAINAGVNVPSEYNGWRARVVKKYMKGEN